MDRLVGGGLQHDKRQVLATHMEFGIRRIRLRHSVLPGSVNCACKGSPNPTLAPLCCPSSPVHCQPRFHCAPVAHPAYLLRPTCRPAHWSRLPGPIHSRLSPRRPHLLLLMAASPRLRPSPASPALAPHHLPHATFLPQSMIDAVDSQHWLRRLRKEARIIGRGL